MLIVGAGLSGLIAAHHWPKATVIEQQPRCDKEVHRAVLRFRSDVVSKIIQVPFKKVMVRKGIWRKGRFVKPNIHDANQYSKKTNGMIMDRSIWNLESAERYVASPDLWNILVDGLKNRISFSEDWDFSVPCTEDVINTAPMPIAAKDILSEETATFKRKGITVVRFQLDDVDVHQTVYFPFPEFPVYRATITGGDVILEMTTDSFEECDLPSVIKDAMEPFAYSGTPKQIEVSNQNYGKIVPIDPDLRRSILMTLTQRRIYSLGRFATWRNILLDDLPKDMEQIDRLRKASVYERKLIGVSL